MRPVFAFILSAAMAAATAGMAQQPLRVELITVAATPKTHTYSLTGTIEPIESYAAGFRDGGLIIAVNVDVGDIVETGDVIAQLDPDQAEAAKRAAQAMLDATDAALVQALQAKDRAEQLLERRTGTRSAVDAATETYLTAQSNRDQAAAGLSKATRATEDTVLRAVQDMIVTERLAEPGQVVSAGQTVVRLANKVGREAVFYAPNVPELNSIIGQPMTLTPLDGGETVQARVSEVSPAMAENGAVAIKMQINAEGSSRLTINQPVVGTAEITSAAVTSVPWTALTATVQGPAVWVVTPADMSVHLRQVTVARHSQDTVEIENGLSDGDIVVAAGSHLMFEGKIVRSAEMPQ